MVETYLEYLTEEYFQVRGLAVTNLVLVQLQNNVPYRFDPRGRANVGEGRKAGGPERCVRTLSRPRVSSSLTEASGMPALTAKAGGWASAKAVEETYLHLASSDLVSDSLERV